MAPSKQVVLWHDLHDENYRREWVSEQAGVGLAFQIRALREDRELTQEELAERLGKSQATVSEWESPDYRRYTLSTLARLAAAFDVALMVRFAPFSELVKWSTQLTPSKLAPASFPIESAHFSVGDGEPFALGELGHSSAGEFAPAKREVADWPLSDVQVAPASPTESASGWSRE